MLKSVQEPKVQSDEARKDVGTVLEAGKWESVQAAKSKSEGHLGREQEGPRAGELKVLSILAIGIPENTTLFWPTLSCTKGYLWLPLAGFAVWVSGIPPQLSWNRFESPSLPDSEKLDWLSPA
jgi:hypothetical protein